MAKYTNKLKRAMCLLVCEEKQSTIGIAAKYNVPLKTFEKWITAYNKDSTVFDDNKPVKYNNSTKPFEDMPDYSSMSNDELQKELMKRDIEIARLKKGYSVKGCGTKKVYVTYSTKNTK